MSGRLSQRGELPPANALPCVDCGHLWQPSAHPHQYDHYLGYRPEHAVDVQPVCTSCPYDRGVARGERPHWRARHGPLSDATTVIQRIGQRCFAPMQVSVRRARLGHGRCCSAACRHAAVSLMGVRAATGRRGHPRVARPGAPCGVAVVFHDLVATGYGRCCSLQCTGLASRTPRRDATEAEAA